MNDSYIHNSTDVMYVLENIPGPVEQTPEYQELINNFNSQITVHCVCDQICDQLLCHCRQKSSAVFSSNETQRETESHLKNEYSLPAMECNDLCRCSSNCENRIVQRGPVDSLYVKQCLEEGKGMGLFTKHHIPKGTFICEYAGEVITKSQALQRHCSNLEEGKMNFIFCLQEYSNRNVFQTFIDPSNFGNIGRYINHSCEANCVIIPVRVNTVIPKLAIFSWIDILPHTEITFNYGPHNIQDLSSENTTRKKCLCSSVSCKGWLPFDAY